MKRIFKFPLVDDQAFISEKVIIPMPKWFTKLHVGLQNGIPTLWAVCDTAAPTVHVEFYVVGTGQSVDGFIGAKHFLGTCQSNTHPLVWHIFGGLEVARE